jgi:hypothetical protein
MTTACDVLGHRFSEVDQLEMSMSMTRDSLKRYNEGNIYDIDDADSNEFAAFVKLDCNIQCSNTLHKPISVCRVCWTKVNDFTKYMMQSASSLTKKSGTDRPKF